MEVIGDDLKLEARIRKAVAADIQQYLTNSLTPDRGYSTPIDNVKTLILELMPPKRKKRLPNRLPDKSPLPPFNVALEWSKRYFDIGDTISFTHPRRDGTQTGVITNIKKNKYGRVSYYIDEQCILLEDIVLPV